MLDKPMPNARHQLFKHYPLGTCFLLKAKQVGNAARSGFTLKLSHTVLSLGVCGVCVCVPGFLRFMAKSYLNDKQG